MSVPRSSEQLCRLRWHATQFTDDQPSVEDIWVCSTVQVARDRAETFAIDGVIEVSDDGNTWLPVEYVGCLVRQ